MNDMSWWRSWHGAPMDHKWPVIAARSGVKVGIVSAIAWALMDYASQQKDRGSIEDFDIEAYAVYSGFSEDEINAVIQAMNDKGIIIDGRFANWEKRQPKSERDIERVTKWREAKQAQSVTPGYEMLRDVTQDTDTDTDSEKEKEESARASAPPDRFHEIQVVIERNTGYPIMPTEGEVNAINEMVSLGVVDTDITDAVAFFSDRGRIARGALSLLPSVKTAYAKRVQGQARASPGSNGRKETISERIDRVAKERDERARNGQKII